MNKQIKMMKKFVVICRDFESFDEYISHYWVPLMATLDSKLVDRGTGACVGEWNELENGSYSVVIY